MFFRGTLVLAAMSAVFVGRAQQPAPVQIPQETATPTLGSVKGKWSPVSRIRRSAPKIERAKYSSVPFRSDSRI